MTNTTSQISRRLGISRRLRSLGFGCSLCVIALGARAEPAFTEKAAAEALFQEGTKLYNDGEFAAACAKFEASHALDEALGTMLRLADCYDRLGKTASAWAAFQGAADMAHAQEQPEREDIARERADDLRARLSYLVIGVSAATRDLRGLKVTLGETVIPEGSWGTPLPANPGSQALTATAPGYQRWSQQVEVSNVGGSQEVLVPALMPIELGERGAAPQARTELRAPPQAEPSSQRTWGYVTGGVGLVALGVGGYFGYRAYDLNAQSMDHCLAGDTTACTTEGKSLRDDARSQGNLATMVSAAGLTLIGVSTVLLLTASDDPHDESVRVQLTPLLTSNNAQVRVEGTW